MSAPQVICAAAAASCQCSLPPDHDGPHHCQRAGCGGMWHGTPGDDFKVVRLPGEDRAQGLLAFLARRIVEIDRGPHR